MLEVELREVLDQARDRLDGDDLGQDLAYLDKLISIFDQDGFTRQGALDFVLLDKVARGAAIHFPHLRAAYLDYLNGRLGDDYDYLIGKGIKQGWLVANVEEDDLGGPGEGQAIQSLRAATLLRLADRLEASNYSGSQGQARAWAEQNLATTARTQFASGGRFICRSHEGNLSQSQFDQALSAYAVASGFLSDDFIDARKRLYDDGLVDRCRRLLHRDCHRHSKMPVVILDSRVEDYLDNNIEHDAVIYTQADANSFVDAIFKDLGLRDDAYGEAIRLVGSKVGPESEQTLLHEMIHSLQSHNDRDLRDKSKHGDLILLEGATEAYSYQLAGNRPPEPSYLRAVTLVEEITANSPDKVRRLALARSNRKRIELAADMIGAPGRGDQLADLIDYQLSFDLFKAEVSDQELARYRSKVRQSLRLLAVNR